MLSYMPHIDICYATCSRFAMRVVIVYAAHRVGKKRSKGTFCRAIVCTILDECKKATTLDSNRVYLKGTSFLITEDRNPKEQERRRQAYASRKGCKMHSK